ncbi:hypothetical protein V8C35DRAFT_316479 [Trichoderma chlorosporum]
MRRYFCTLSLHAFLSFAWDAYSWSKLRYYPVWLSIRTPHDVDAANLGPGTTTTSPTWLCIGYKYPSSLFPW